MSDIYNKNAREKALLQEAYTNIYNEEFNPRRDAPEHSEGDPHPAQRAAESIIGAQVMWDGMMKRGQVEEVDVENGVAVVYDEDGGEHIVQLGDFDVVLPVEDGEFAVDLPDGTSLNFDYDEGKKRRLGSTRPARTAEERRLATAEGGYMVGRGDPRVKRPERTQFAISGDEEEPGAAEKEDNIEYAKRHRDHSKGVKMAIEALEMFKDELHIDGHPEDINVNEVADAHEQLVRSLNILFDDTDVDYITGGRDRQFGEEADRARFEEMGDYIERGN